MRRRDLQVVCAAIRYQSEPGLESYCASFRHFGLARLGSIIRYFHRHQVTEVSWAGWLRKQELFRPWRLLALVPDWRIIKLYFFEVADRQNQTLLAAVANVFESEGLTVSHSAKYCPELLAGEGVLGRWRPTPAELEDIAFGWNVAKRMADLDVGQSVAVSEKSTLAVEGVEGTDQNIRRAGRFARHGGFTVVKLAKPGHDMRFDVPAVGPDTIEAMHEAGGKVLALEAGKTLILDREATLARADQFGITVVAFREPPQTG
jgi:DUF1009 family protein